MKEKPACSNVTKVMNHIRDKKLTSFCASDFVCLELTTRQAKSALENLTDRGLIYHHGLEDIKNKNRARVLYGTSKTPSKIVSSEREIKIANYFEGKLLGWQSVFPSMFNPVLIKGNVTIHKQSMV